jgi:urease accessory protein
VRPPSMNLRIFQLGDSALPIGGYSHSWGLEAAVAQGQVKDAVSLEHWVRNWLVLAAGPLEGVVVAAVCHASGHSDWTTAVAANELLWISLTPTTLRHASRDMGEQLLSLADTWPWATAVTQELQRSLPEGQWHHAPVFGAVASVCGGTPTEAVAVFLHQAALGMISAGVRAIPIGHTHGQQILARLQDELQTLAEDLAHRPLETAGSSCPAYEVLCHDQSRLYTRLFRS